MDTLTHKRIEDDRTMVGLMILSTLILIGLALYLMLLTMWMAILIF